MERLCREPDTTGDIPKDRAVFDQEHVFPGGLRMAVQVCSTNEPETYPCWTQAVLLDPEGHELGFTDVGESLLGSYTIEHGDDTYTVIYQVVEDAVPRHTCEFVLSSDLLADHYWAIEVLSESSSVTWGDSNRSLVAASRILRVLREYWEASDLEPGVPLKPLEGVDELLVRLEDLGETYVDLEN